MASRFLDYPYPVLDRTGKDFPGCSFGPLKASPAKTDDSVSEDEIVLDGSCAIACPGMERMLETGQAAAYLWISCNRTSKRELRRIANLRRFSIELDSSQFAGFVDIKVNVIAAESVESYSLPEFNQEYFRGERFSLRRGDIIATEPGVTVQLEPAIEENIPSIIQVALDRGAESAHTYYAKDTDTEPGKRDYIYVFLPEAEYKAYATLRKARYMRNRIARLIQSSIILPALVGGVALLRDEAEWAASEDADYDSDGAVEEESEWRYGTTIWGESLVAALAAKGFSELDSLSAQGVSDFDLANMILDNVIGDSLDIMQQNFIDGSMEEQEDEEC